MRLAASIHRCGGGSDPSGWPRWGRRRRRCLFFLLLLLEAAACLANPGAPAIDNGDRPSFNVYMGEEEVKTLLGERRCYRTLLPPIIARGVCFRGKWKFAVLLHCGVSRPHVGATPPLCGTLMCPNGRLTATRSHLNFLLVTQSYFF